ncbi:MAG: glutamate-1-semialdehyde 2,1-aminomutase [Succiniclasticum sp.]|jgi:glutamate-1-semialdehyde-2,1-aminomutase|nr:glutamate-1-semialdehyde 2,1-aminomutase [Selenomonadales bacterium]MDY2870262.1 glutamate-1-semialdehyde 2,1-aminomutase [Succiniclasticum sp.]MDY6304062.1 glutamate-1-semialdehyde 2,1-aminomutase [Succiniclasticum sp.]
MKITQSEALFAAAKKVMPGGVNSPVRSFRSVGGVPPFLVRGEGSHVVDADGNRYIDYVLSYGPLLLGHAAPMIGEAIKKATDHGTSYGAPTPDEVTLARLVTSLLPSMEMVRMVNSGTEATMSAIRLARAYTGREYILKFIGCYHGHSDSLLVQAGSGASTFGVPDSPGVTKGTAATTLSVPFNDLPALEKVFAAKGRDIAAVIMEPTPGNMGLILPKDGYLPAVQDLARRYGSLLIIDEVMSGFRAAQGGSQSLYGIDPDITCLGKVIGGGLPVAAYGGKRKIMEMVSPVGPMYQAGTLSGNPLAMAAGIAALTWMRDHKVCDTLPERCAALCKGLADAAAAACVPVRIHHLGSMFTVFFTDKDPMNYDDVCACDKEAFKIYFHTMLENGVYLPPSQFETNFISLAHSDEDFAQTIAAARKAFAAIASR